MNLVRPFLALAAALAAVPASGSVSTMSFDEVEAGMRGTGRTVFAGEAVETFEVEILGKLPNVAPRRNLILGRCTGGPLADTGILAGMSGSPVYVDGKLLGAIAYSWGFAKDAIAGITPIEEMLRIGASGGGAGAAGRGSSAEAGDLARLRRPAELEAFFARRFAALAPAATAARPIGLPLAVSGLGTEGLDRLGSELGRAGFVPVQAGGAGAEPGPAGPPGPGSAVGLKLVRGDVDLTATGTVTWVDGDRLLAFGHPLFGLGRVDLPLTGARVEALLPSLSRSARLATPLAEVGALREDRATGVLARLGGRARMIPVRVQLTRTGGPTRRFAFDVAEDPLLAPLLLYAAMNAVLAGEERVFGSVTVGLEEGSVIKLDGREDVGLDNLFTGPTAPYYATGTSAFILYLLMNNDWAPPRIEGVNMILGYDAEPRRARIRRVTLDRYRVHAGETITATIVLTPYRGPDLVLDRAIDVPAETAPGRLVLHVGGALAVSRAEGTGEPVLPRDLDQLIFLINRLRRNNNVYIVASRDDAGVFLGGARLPNLPPSVNSILSRPRSTGNFAVVPQRGILEEEVPTDYEIEGLTRVQVEVEAP